MARRGLDAIEGPYVFVDASRRGTWRAIRAGEAMETRSLFNIVRGKVDAIVGRPVSPHALRHSFASRLRHNGAPLELIQEALGHASITTTTIYAHISTAKRQADLTRYLDGGAR
jgi:site-specific recombinase XerD